MNSIQNKINRFSIELMNAISNEKLILPSLPDIALNVKNECEKDDSTSDNIAEIITQDPAMAARLLQISNSSLYRTHNKTENIQMAITKLGFKMVRDLILNLSMKQLYNTSSYVLEERFRELWFCSTKQRQSLDYSPPR